MTDPKVVVVDEQGAEVQGAEVPSTVRPRPEQIIVGLKDGEAPFDGDILVTMAPAKAKLKYGTRMSVRPQPDKCVCKGRGWGVVEEDDGSRFKRRVPTLCKCIRQVVAKICGPEAVMALWEPPVGDPVLAKWRADLAAAEEAAAIALSTIQTERKFQASEAEAEADRVEAAATAAEPAAAEAAKALGEARDAVAAVVSTVEQAKEILADAEKTLARHRKALFAAEIDHSSAAHAVNREGAARLRATAVILRGPKGEWADKERRATAALERVRREMKAAAGRTVVMAQAAQASGAKTTKSDVRLAETKDSAP